MLKISRKIINMFVVLCFLFIVVGMSACGGTNEPERKTEEKTATSEKTTEDIETLAWKMVVIGAEGESVAYGSDLEQEYLQYLNKLVKNQCKINRVLLI